MKVKVKTSPILLSARVANRASGMNEVLHDDTLVGNGNKEPLGVNPDIIPDVSNFTTRDELHMLAGEVSEVRTVIPATANPENQLADQGFVNSSIQTSTAHFRGNWDTWEDVPSEAELYPADAHGNHAPTPNDYLVVVDDAQGGTWRYKYTGVWAEQGKDGWRAEYQINETPLTAAQLAALNSGVTAQAVADIATNKNNITGLQNGKQDKLVAGNGITIDGNTISASGGGGGASLPDQTGNAGKFLQTDGETASWGEALTNKSTHVNATAIGYNKQISTWKGDIYIGTPDSSTLGKSVGGVTVIGEDADVTTSTCYNAIAIGNRAKVGARYAIQLGGGTNSHVNTFKVGNGNGNFEMMDADGNVPLERLTYVTQQIGDISAALDAINGEAI